MDDVTFEAQLAERLNADAESGTRPFDARVIAQAAVERAGTVRRGWLDWHVLPALRPSFAMALIALVTVVAVATYGVFNRTQVAVLSTPSSSPSAPARPEGTPTAYPLASSTPYGSPDARPSALASSKPAYADWSRASIELPDGAISSYASDVVEFRGQYVAVGGVELSDGERSSVLWTSADGADWTVVPNSGFAIDAEIFSLAANDRLIVAVGSHSSPGPKPESPPPYVFVSSDGRAWTEVDPPAQLARIAALPDLFVAVGRENIGTSREQTFVWTSPDGIAWTKAPDSVGLEEAGVVRLRVVSVAGRPTLFAVGTSDHQSALWVADDPVAGEWRRLLSGVSGSPNVTDLAASASGRLLAVGTAYCCRIRAWSSSDAVDWRPTYPDVAGGWSVGPAVGTPSGFLMLGAYGDTHNGPLGAWATPDGEAWLSVGDAPNARGEPVALVTRPDGAVIAIANEAFAPISAVGVASHRLVAWVVQP